MTQPDPSLAAALSPARLLAHHAAAIPSELGVTWLPHDEGFQFSNLGWDEGRRALVGQDVQGLTAGLRVADLTWQVWRGGELVGEKAAQGSTLAEGRAWLRALAVEQGLPDRPIQSSTWDMPEHPVATGAAFPAPPTELTQLAAWFSLAAGVLAEVVRGRAGASPVRVWPHHFDIATLVTLDAGKSAEEARSVGLGLSPGDGGIPEPYFYVNPWPVPEERSGPALAAGGTWNTEGWFGAMLAGSAVSSEDPRGSSLTFLRSGMQACLQLLSER